ncbi:RNA helicase aquarius-like [Hydractinia symbiolongicarpus]|uniref:RNA helicase aquarius-like n=1 Tax=Hydractinia symbiolongicarpus TaxID=13093 RepID=UPI00254EF1AB|nr:RNA helicase aquarius-like [Hydractinia symbiolongicarpus]
MGDKKLKNNYAPTVEQIQADVLTQYAHQHWAHSKNETEKKFDAKIIDTIYVEELQANKFPMKRIMLLEFSQYLENYLWKNFSSKNASRSHIISICILVNEKCRERVPPWEVFKEKPEEFEQFYQNVLRLVITKDKLSIKERTILLIFLIRCFNSLEVDLIREQVQKLISLPMWTCLLPGRLEQELKAVSRYRKYWNIIKKKDAKADVETLKKMQFERTFLSDLIGVFFTILNTIPEQGDLDNEAVTFCERFIELMLDLQSLLPTRRFFNVLIDNHHVVVRCRLSNLAKHEKGKLFNQLVDMLKFYCGFEINDHTGTALTDHEMTEVHYEKITSLQRAVFKHYRNDALDFAMANVANVDTRQTLTKYFKKLSTKKLHGIAAHLNLVPKLKEVPEGEKYDKTFLLELLISRHERRLSQIQILNRTPLYPTEQILWDENVVPTAFYSGEGCLALPKLNLQFLTLHDYLLRNHNLFQLESTYEVRGDIEDAISRMKPWKSEYGETIFDGWARMAVLINNFSVMEVGKPKVGETCPSRVKADVAITLSTRQMLRKEWEGLRKHDVCFLITLRAKKTFKTVKYDRTLPFHDQYGLEYIRGCEIEGMLDEEGHVIEEGPDPKPVLKGSDRTYRVLLDCNQYEVDMKRTNNGDEDVYETFNIFMRRKPKENNFKAVLETIRDLMNTECLVPDWIHDIFLGYDDPAAAHYTKMDSQITKLDFVDTFLTIEHLKTSFPNYVLKCDFEEKLQVPPFKITFPDEKITRKRKAEEGTPVVEKKEIIVEPYVIPNRGPYPYNKPKMNTVPFTPTQVEAIKSGMEPGLTMVVGPPGTGKTDVAVQIISNIYHNFPEQRTLIVTHSNQALNQLFEKIMALDIDERHLLRLGHGEESLETEKDFSRYGRVNFVLARRLHLLEEVQRLQQSLGVTGDVAYTCETAGHFYLYQVVARWEEYLSNLKKKPGDVEAIDELFPFKIYFLNAPKPLFKRRSYEEDWDIAEGCFRHLQKIFTELEEFRAFELLRSGRDRSKYLLIKTAKIIAMTCTHAALRRRDLVELNFKYDNVLMEEAAQILEIETFIPLMLQNPEDGYNRLKRVILIGDHHQLPPVIKNMAFQKFSNMEQSLFTRFVRLGVPYVELDAQGRARPSLCQLYSWRYDNLGNLQHVVSWPKFKVANPGLFYDYQLINISDFNGVGESEPNPYFYQNLGEAEYCVALFMYMRLLGYPASSISILTTYNGQKHLIRDVINKRCADSPLIGRPHKVTTVDRYQGQQNDYIILSLVRTKTVGHIRDVRRLIVAMSRARLGLYVFARVSLFENCFELRPAFAQLMSRPMELFLAPHEKYPSHRPIATPPDGKPYVVQDMPQLAQFVYNMYSEKLKTIELNEKVKQEQAKKVEKVEPEVVPKDEEEENVEKPMETGELIVNEVGEDITDK